MAKKKSYNDAAFQKARRSAFGMGGKDGGVVVKRRKNKPMKRMKKLSPRAEAKAEDEGKR